MNRRSLCVMLALSAALASTATRLCAQDGLEGAMSRANLAQPLQTHLTSLFEQRLAAADFDNDHKPDGAILLNSGLLHNRNSFRIELHLSASTNTDLTFESEESSLSIAALDINKDGATDVIVEQALTHRRLFVWLGDGRGGFRRARTEDFPSKNGVAGPAASTPSSGSRDSALSLPPQRRFENTLLKASSISGRLPSMDETRTSASIDSPTLHVFVLLASRAPPLFHSL